MLLLLLLFSAQVVEVVAAREGLVVLLVADVLVPALAASLRDPLVLVVVGIAQKLARVVVDHAAHRVVEAVAAVVAIRRHLATLQLTRQLRSTYDRHN